MKVSFLQSHLGELKYSGNETTHTIVVDGGGGTAGAGLITLTDDTAHVIDLGVTTTVALLDAAILALPGWDFRVGSTGPSNEIFQATVISGADLLEDVASEVVGVEYRQSLPFANSDELEVVGGSASAAPAKRACPVYTGDTDLVTLEVGVTVTAAQTADVTVLLGVSSDPGVDGNGEVRVLALSDFDDANLISVVVAGSGSTGVRSAETLDIERGSAEVISVVSIANANAAAVSVDVSLLR